MNTYKLNIDISAYTQAEAEARLQLLIQLTAFFSDFDVNSLAAVFVKYQLLNFLGKTNTKAA